MNPDRAEYEGACHCGTVRFRVRLTNGLHTARRCTCSFCRMRGAVAVSANLSDITVHAGQDNLQLYQFNTGQARHYFCRTCGIHTHHQRRSNPEQYGVNVSCLDGLSPYDLAEVPLLDGVNHPKDHPGSPRVAGVVRVVRPA